MRMKRLASLLLAALLGLSLAGCAIGGKHAAMAIRPAQLSQEEEAFAQLLDVGLDAYRIFDFQMDEKSSNVQTMQLAVYELVDGEWSALAKYQEAFLDATGRIALGFGKLTEGVRTAVQSEGGCNAQDLSIQPGEDEADMVAYLTTVLTESASMEFDKEVPLVVQIATSKSEIYSCNVSSFHSPEQFEKRGYEHVYAVTVMFSQKTVAELERAEKDGR